MEEPHNLYFRHLRSRLGGIVGEMTRVHHVTLAAQGAWHPAVNVYRCSECILICVELAGVEQSQITVAVESRRVWLRGHRPTPEPQATEGPLLQVLVMEIDHGVFEREVVLPVDVVPERVQAEQRKGLLWIFLPVAEQP